jgi:GNAT superfamily N-acetyltransferase
MCTIQTVNPVEYIPVIGDLLRANWAETGYGPAFDPDVGAYQRLHDAGLLFAVAAFEGATVIGYCTVVVTPYLHNPAITMAANDALFVDPAYRGGTVTARIMRAVENEARARGASEMMWHCRAGTDFAQTLTRHGYTPLDVVVSKGL